MLIYFFGFFVIRMTNAFEKWPPYIPVGNHTKDGLGQFYFGLSPFDPFLLKNKARGCKYIFLRKGLL